MTTRSLNTFLILLVTLIIAGAGYYQVEVRQPGELEQIEETKKAARLQEAELEQLFVEEAASQEKAEEMTRLWRARYKYIPSEMRTPDIVQYLQELSTTGFEQFAYKHTSRGMTPDFGFYLFEVSGTATYRDLYRFIWELENNRQFFQVTDLDLAHTYVYKVNDATGVRKELNMVSFSMKLKAFFGGSKGLSADEDVVLPDVPESMLPARSLPHDSFYPLVRKDLPPNDKLLADVETGTLVSIAGNRAMLKDQHGLHILEVGDKVYLGEVLRIDPQNALMRVSLNKGGNSVEFDVKVEVDPFYLSDPDEDSRRIPSSNENR